MQYHPEFIRQWINDLIDACVAENIPFSSTEGIPAENVQAAIENIKTQLDAAVISQIVPDGSITTAKIADKSITADKLADGAVLINVGTDNITDGAVTEPKIADNAVSEAKLADGSVTTSKLGTYAVTSTKLASGAVSETKLADGAVITAKIADGAITYDKLATGIIPKITFVPRAEIEIEGTSCVYYNSAIKSSSFVQILPCEPSAFSWHKGEMFSKYPVDGSVTICTNGEFYISGRIYVSVLIIN